MSFQVLKKWQVCVICVTDGSFYSWTNTILWKFLWRWKFCSTWVCLLRPDSTLWQWCKVRWSLTFSTLNIWNFFCYSAEDIYICSTGLHVFQFKPSKERLYLIKKQIRYPGVPLLANWPQCSQIRCTLLSPTTRYADGKITSLRSTLPFTARDIQAAVTGRVVPHQPWFVFKAVFHKEWRRCREDRDKAEVPSHDAFIKMCCNSTNHKLTRAGFTGSPVPISSFLLHLL